MFEETDTYFQDSLIIRTFKTTAFIYLIKYNIYNIVMFWSIFKASFNIYIYIKYYVSILSIKVLIQIYNSIV